MRDTLKVEKTQCLQYDYDTGKSFLITNKGEAPITVNKLGQIPYKFNADVTGHKNYIQRNQLSCMYETESRTLRAAQANQAHLKALSVKVGAPKSLSNAKNARVKYYTPAKNKLFGYTQIPRQQVMPYQNDIQYQKLLKRHQDKGHLVENFDFPYSQGAQLKTKTENTINSISKYAISKKNIDYGMAIQNEGRKRPDTTSGFRKGHTYLQGRRNVMLQTF